jgi:hypothetical protein
MKRRKWHFVLRGQIISCTAENTSGEQKAMCAKCVAEPRNLSGERFVRIENTAS